MVHSLPSHTVKPRICTNYFDPCLYMGHGIYAGPAFYQNMSKS